MGRAGVYLCGLLARLRGPPAAPGGQALPLVQFADGGGVGGGHGGGGANGVSGSRDCVFLLPLMVPRATPPPTAWSPLPRTPR